MRRRWSTVVIALACLGAVIGIPVGRAQAAEIDPSDCFSYFYIENNGLWGHINDSDQVLYFNESSMANADEFCQARVAAGSPVVVIYDISKQSEGEYDYCLSFSSAATDFYLHNPGLCTGTSTNYLMWIFPYIKPAGDGNKIYQMQNQDADYDEPCVYVDSRTKKAESDFCFTDGDTHEYIEVDQVAT